jgi:hypothetical protein
MSGVEFQKVNGVTRSVYKQFDGSIKLADECICWDGVKKLNCPIDEHAAAARNPEKSEASTGISTVLTSESTKF